MQQNHIAETIERFPITWSKGFGSKLYDDTGKEYIDFFSGHAVMALGYAHPEQQLSMKAQMENLIHSGNLYHVIPQMELATELCNISFANKVFFANSGAEIVDLSIKIARRYKKINSKIENPSIICMSNSFHGRTFGALSATGQTKYKQSMGSMLPDIKHITFNNCSQLKEAFDHKTAAILLEPIQGDGGIIEATSVFLTTARELCDTYDSLLIFDEIQTGLGRTGTPFCYQRCPVDPDIILLGKPLGGGLPISALLTTDKIASVMTIGDHGSTFGGNPVAAAAGNILIKELQKPNFFEALQKKSHLLLSKLNAIMQEFPNYIKDIRGKGLMLGIELTANAKQVVSKALSNGLVINNPIGQVLRIIPALTIQDNEITEGCQRLRDTIASIKKMETQ